ncbi:MAG: N-acetyltransferase [Bacteroidetes bacterium]|nr:N-acetyltransferase [Bacteroidota bacterium]MBS1929567.1 N-acetyltransferase [Bacteroidota bacterium]
MCIIRLATPLDAQDILNIYAPYIRNTSFTFETEIPSLSDFANRINDYLKQWPWLVCEINGMIAGYAYGGKYRERTAYQWCVESSIYIHDDFQKNGIGKTLYDVLIEILNRQGFRNVYAVINLPNEKSVAFHESLGFTYFAIYEKVGYKLGKWKNVGWWQLSINEYGDEPKPPITFSELNKDFLPALLEEKSKMIKR